MSDGYLLAGLSLGVVLLVGYLIVRVGYIRAQPSASEAFRVFLSTMGASTAIKICSLALSDVRLNQLLDNERAYIFLGGIAALWVCVESVVRVFVGAVAVVPVPPSN